MTNPLTILYLSDSVIPSQRANAVHVMKMCEGFAANGHEVILLCRTPVSGKKKDIYKQYGVEPTFEIKTFATSAFPGTLFFYAFKCLFFILRRRKIDLIYSRFILGSFFASKVHNNIVLELHKIPFGVKNFSRSWFGQLMKSKALKQIIVISETLRLAISKLTSKPVFVAHDAANVPLNKEICDLKGDMTRLNVGYTGSLYPGKGLDVIEHVSALLPEVNFHIVGGNEAELNHWRTRINQPNVFFYGHVPQASVSGYINAFDVCLLPNQRSVKSNKTQGREIGEFTSPLKMFEYMAHKKAIIASDLPVLREVLDESIAVLVGPDDYEGWAKAIGLLGEDLNLRNELATRAYEKLVAHYTWKKRAEKVLRMNYRNVD